MKNITTLLFDLGGVLVELGDVSSMMATSPVPANEIWEGWIRSPAVRRFESGESKPEEFANEMIAEFELDLLPQNFLDAFIRWPKGLFPGALELVENLSGHYDLVCLSNTNDTHHRECLGPMGILDRFQHTFLSHQTGLLKPRPEAFQRVLDTTGLPAEQILFFDDSPGNVEAARKLGLQAEQVLGPTGVLERLNALELHH